MTPVRIAALALGAAGLVGLGVVVGDLVVDDPPPGDTPDRAAVEVAGDQGPDAATPVLSIVSVGGADSAGEDDGAEGDAPGGDDGAVDAAADLSQDAVDVDALAVFDTAVEESGDTAELPAIPEGVTVDEPDEVVYAPFGGEEGTVEDLGTDTGAADDGTTDGEGDGAADDTAGDTDDAGTDADPAITMPEGVPPIDPDVYELDVDLPPVIGFDDPCAVGALAGCPFGVPALVLGDQPVVPLRLGSVAVLGTETFHRTACTELRSRDIDRAEGVAEPILLAITTNQGADIEVDLEGGNGPTLTAEPEASDLALAQLVGELRTDGRTPSEGPGSVITCLAVPASSIEGGFVRGKARAIVGDQRDTLGFEFQVASSDRSLPIRISTTWDRRDPAPDGSTSFMLSVPQRAPDEEISVIGFVPLGGSGLGPRDCAVFNPELDALRSVALGGRDADDGTPGLPFVLSTPPDEGTYISPYGTFPMVASGEDPYDAKVRGYLPQQSRYRLCVWWFDLEEDGDAHRITGGPTDTATLDVRTPSDIRAGVYVTAITLPEPRPPGHYNLYLVKPGVAAICLPRKRPEPFPVGPVGDAAATPFAETRIAESEPEINEAEGTASTGDAAEAEARIPAGRHEFGPRQAQQFVRICRPRAASPLAIPMVKAGDSRYRPGAPPFPLAPGLPLVPEGLEPPPLGKTIPVIAPDGAILDLTVVNSIQAQEARRWSIGREEPVPPATVRSSIELLGEPSLAPGEERGGAALALRFNENVEVRARLTTSSGDDPFDVCATGGAVTEATSPAGPTHDLEFNGLCAGVSYGVSIEATNADGATTTFVGGSYRVPPNAGFFNVGVEVTSVPDGGAELSVADVQFLRQPGVVSLSTRVRADDLLATCLSGGEVDDDATVLTSFGEQAQVRVRIEGSVGCGGGPGLRVDSTLELAALDLVSGPLVFDVTHPSGLTLQVTITPRDVTS